jgi:hypothetical protein
MAPLFLAPNGWRRDLSSAVREGGTYVSKLFLVSGRVYITISRTAFVAESRKLRLGQRTKNNERCSALQRLLTSRIRL